METKKLPIDDILVELEQIQKNVIELITDFRDNFKDHPEQSMILKGFSDASGEIHKMTVRIATGKQIIQPENKETNP
jgi:hypothetical protein